MSALLESLHERPVVPQPVHASLERRLLGQSLPLSAAVQSVSFWHWQRLSALQLFSGQWQRPRGPRPTAEESVVCLPDADDDERNVQQLSSVPKQPSESVSEQLSGGTVLFKVIKKKCPLAKSNFFG